MFCWSCIVRGGLSGETISIGGSGAIGMTWLSSCAVLILQCKVAASRRVGILSFLS